MTHQILSRPIKKDIKNRSGHRLIGITLVVIGIFWIAKNGGWIPVTLSFGEIFWPLALCCLGIFMMAGITNRKSKHSE